MYCPNIHFRFSVSEVSCLKLVVLLEDIWLHVALSHSIGGTSWNAAACVRRSSVSQKVEGPWAQGRAGQMWVAGLCSPRVAWATDISVGPDWLPALFTAVSHCIQVILDHTWALNGSSLSMSKLLGGAQNALTGKFDQHNVYKCHLPPGALCPWVMLRADDCPCNWCVPMGNQAVPHHSPAGSELALKCSMRADDGEAPGTLFLLFIHKHHTESPESKDFI